ncbi:MAG: hypothetical protein CMO44_11460, partial [Verrucomicrobiales bacterium]|nr:hypothetical protein [Verrucomicrobiales bacterium]
EERLAELGQPGERLARPSLDRYNVEEKWIEWTWHGREATIMGKSLCLISTEDIPIGNALLLLTKNRALLKKKILSKYPISFEVGGVSMVPKEAISAPVLCNGVLVNFMELENKFCDISFSKDLDAYNYHFRSPKIKRRRVFLSNGSVEKIVDPSLAE